MAQYWFRKRRGITSRDLGYGWIPISSEGWIMTLVFIIVLYGLTKYYEGIHLVLAMLIGVFVFAYFADKRTKDKVIFK